MDAEGYSIRPEDAASLSKFSDSAWSKKEGSDSDSDLDDGEKIISLIGVRVCLFVCYNN